MDSIHFAGIVRFYEQKLQALKEEYMKFNLNKDLILTSVFPRQRDVKTGHTPFIGRSKGATGVLTEKKRSYEFHQEGIPLLVSAHLLRERGLGQIDLARIKKERGDWILEIAEVKSSEVGVQGMSRFQSLRLKESQNFLSSIMGVRTRPIVLVG